VNRSLTSLSSLSALAAVPAWAADAAPGPVFGVMQMLLGLAFVLGLIVFASWLLRRFGAGPTAPGSLVRIVTAASVGPREKVVLVEIKDSWLVLGVAPGRVSMLHQLPRQALPQDSPQGVPGFGRWLAEARRGRQATPPEASA
jgi:flagellar protein FliO/FliZ